MNSLKKSIRRTSFETLTSLACYTETITNETLQTTTRMDFFGLFTIFQMHFFQIAAAKIRLTVLIDFVLAYSSTQNAFSTLVNGIPLHKFLNI